VIAVLLVIVRNVRFVGIEMGLKEIKSKESYEN